MGERMNVLQHGDIALHYKIDGSPGGATVLFANSLGTDLRVWDPLIPHLPPGLRTVRYDKRGHGLSDVASAPYAMIDHVSDAQAVLEGVVEGPVVVVGLSIGGMIALGLSEVRPDLVRACVLVDTGHRIGTLDLWNDRIDAVTRNGISSLADGVLELWFSEHFRRNDPSLALWRNMLCRTTAEGYAGSCAAIRDANFTNAARTIAVPSLCIVGTEDGATPPALVRELASLIPNASYTEIVGVGHLPCVEAPDRLASLISSFLKEHDLV